MTNIKNLKNYIRTNLKNNFPYVFFPKKKYIYKIILMPKKQEKVVDTKIEEIKNDEVKEEPKKKKEKKVKEEPKEEIKEEPKEEPKKKKEKKVKEEPKEEIKEEPKEEPKKKKEKKEKKVKEEPKEEPKKKEKKVKGESKKKEKKNKKEKIVKEDDKEKSDGKRYFKCIYDGGNYGVAEHENAFGRFSGKKPMQAANKALTTIIKELKKNGVDVIGKEITFGIKECTRGCKKGSHMYVGIRKLNEDGPVIVKKTDADGNERQIKYKYTNSVKKLAIKKE